MVLCMDENGRIYQASRDSAKGGGVEAVEVAAQDYGVNLYQNPYQAAVNENVKQINAIKIAEQKEDLINMGHARAQKRNKEMSLRRAESEIKKEASMRPKLVEEAVMQGMNGADFDQLSIVDSNYGKVHAAILQGMGRRPQMGDSQYISDQVYQDPFEYQQYSIANKAYVAHGEQEIKNQEFYKAAVALPVANSKGVVDDRAKRLLTALNEGELYFETEDEANAYNKLSLEEQKKYLQAHPEVYGEEEAAKTISKTALVIGAAAIIYLLK